MNTIKKLTLAALIATFGGCGPENSPTPKRDPCHTAFETRSGTMIELTDMDGDGTYDALKITKPFLSYGERGPREEYFIKEGKLARSPDVNMNLHVVKAEFFDVYNNLAYPSRKYVIASNLPAEK